jgi:hypothetical protein
MDYSVDMPAAARRNLEAARQIATGPRRDVAGYLYGIAAECAIKAMMIDAGIRPLDPESRREDPHYMHFPSLRNALLDKIGGRRAGILAKFVGDPRFLTEWSTSMRYCNGREIRESWLEKWAEQAVQAVASMGT